MCTGGQQALQRALIRSHGIDMTSWKRRYLDAATSDRSGGQHTTGVRWWLVFMCWVMRLDPLPPGSWMQSWDVAVSYEDLLEDYAVWLAVARPSGRQVNHESIGKYVSTVRSWYRRRNRARLGLGSEGSRIADLLRGYARLVPQPPPLERIGVTPEQLALGWSARGTSQMFRAMTAVALIGLMRGIEVCVEDDGTFETEQHLVPADVSLATVPARAPQAARALRLRMRKRKDLRVLRGKHDSVLLPQGGDGAHFDVVDELMEWLRQRRAAGLPDSAPLFCHPDGGGVRVSELRAEVKATMAAIGLDPALYGAHSLRIGGATAALAAGVPPSLIRLMGRWSSDVYLLYCRMSLESAFGVGQSIASAQVHSGAGQFHEEHLELTHEEVEAHRGFDDDESTGDWRDPD